MAQNFDPDKKQPDGEDIFKDLARPPHAGDDDPYSRNAERVEPQTASFVSLSRFFEADDLDLSKFEIDIELWYEFSEGGIKERLSSQDKENLLTYIRQLRDYGGSSTSTRYTTGKVAFQSRYNFEKGVYQIF